MAGQSASVLREIVYRKRHSVETKWPDLSRARSEIHREWLQLAHLLKEKPSLVCCGQMKSVFLSPGEKRESLSVYTCLSLVRTQMTSALQCASGLLHDPSTESNSDISSLTEATRGGVASVLCMLASPSAVRACLLAGTHNAQLGTLKRFLPCLPAFCRRGKPIMSCGRSYPDINATRWVQHEGKSRV